MWGKFQISTRSISPLEHIKHTIQPDRFWLELNVVVCFNNPTTDPHNIHFFSVQPISQLHLWFTQLLRLREHITK